MHANKLNNLNQTFNSGAVSVAAAVTVNNTAAINFTIAGQFRTALALGAKTPAYIDEAGVALSPAPTLAAGEGVIVVWATDSAGNVKGLLGPKTKVNANGEPVSGLGFPTIPDNLTPYAFYTVKATGAVTFGTTNFSGGNATTVAFDITALPSRALKSFTAI